MITKGSMKDLANSNNYEEQIKFFINNFPYFPEIQS